jgi:hypothetical protein
MDRARLGGLLLVPALVAGLLSAPATAAPQGSSACSSAVLVLESLHIEAVPSKENVRPGDTFTVDVTVTRPAHRDPLDQGIEWGEPPVSVPAENVIVGLSVWVGDYTYFWQMGKTDENGKDTLKLRVPENSEHGWAIAMASAYYWQKQDCPDIKEEGFTPYPEFVKVVP